MPCNNIIIILLGLQKGKKILQVAKNTDNHIRPVFFTPKNISKMIGSLF